jgi:hypothetical protein
LIRLVVPHPKEKQHKKNTRQVRIHATVTVVTRACLFFIGRDVAQRVPPYNQTINTPTYLFQGVFQAWQPRLHQMNVLQQDPTATFTEFVHAVFSTVFLALAHGNVEKFFVRDVFRVFLHPPSGVYPGKQREEDGGGGAGFIDGFSNVERGLPNVFGPNVRFHKTRQLRRQSIRPHQPNDQQAVKAGQI